MRFVSVVFLLSVGVSACGGGSSAPSTPTSSTPPVPQGPTVVGLTVSSPGCASDVCGATAGDTLQMTAVARLSDNTNQTVTSTAQWSSANTAVATVSASGLVTVRAAGDSDIVATYQGRLHGQTVRARAAGPRTSFGAGTYLVGREIASGRYFTDPADGCYWERLRGLGGSLGDIIANDFVGYNAAQIIVDIASADLAFKTDADCGTWSTNPRRGLAANITPGAWLVGSQVSPGTYSANAARGCYWERLRGFSGELSSIIANDFVSGGGRVLVTIQGGDVGFQADSECGEFTRVSTVLSFEDQSGSAGSGDIAFNRSKRRQRLGLPPS